jgi:alkaline phosphatase
VGDIVTDSAAAGTAMASGVKTLNGVIGKDANKKNIANILEIAKKAGKRVGIVTSTHIFHATPAAFFAHANHRNNNEEMGRDIQTTSVDIIFGGGKKVFKPYRKKMGNDFMIIDNLTDLKACPKKKLIGIFASKHMPYVYDRTKADRINLKNMTKKAIECLSSAKNGFVLMVEGGRIDHALHKRKIIHALFEAKEFDDTIGQSISQLKSLGIDKETLILSTADHDTGGLSVNAPASDKLGFFTKKNGKLEINKTQHYSGKGPFFPVLKLNTDDPRGNETDSGHTGVDVDLYARGPGSDKIHGTVENTDVFKFLKEGLGL